MRRQKLLIDDERGSASLEFIGAGLVLLIPLIYLIVTLAQVQAQSLGIEAVARHVARVVSQNPTAASHAQTLANTIAGQYGIAEGNLSVDISCPESVACPAAGAAMTITVTAAVPLPLVPISLAGGIGSVQLKTSSTHVVSEG